MSDRTLCDSTKVSRKLANLSPKAYGLFPYIFQETDDYGRLDTDPVLIKAQRFPLINWITIEMIEKCLQEYNQIGLLFLWEFEQHRYGYFIKFEARSGKFLSKRRKSQIPEPPADILANWLKDNNHFKTIQNPSYKLSQVKLSQVKLSQVKEIKDGEEKNSPSLSPSQQKEKISQLVAGITKSIPSKSSRYKSEEDKIIEPLWNFYKQYFPNCKKCNWGVMVKIIRGEDYPFTPENKIREAIEGTHQDNLYKKLDDPWARFLDRICQPSKYK